MIFSLAYLQIKKKNISFIHSYAALMAILRIKTDADQFTNSKKLKKKISTVF